MQMKCVLCIWKTIWRVPFTLYLGGNRAMHAYCAQGVQYVCEPGDLPNLAPFRLIIHDLDRESCHLGQVPAPRRGIQAPRGSRARTAHCAQGSP